MRNATAHWPASRYKQHLARICAAAAPVNIKRARSARAREERPITSGHVCLRKTSFSPHKTDPGPTEAAREHCGSVPSVRVSLIGLFSLPFLFFLLAPLGPAHARVLPGRA